MCEELKKRKALEAAGEEHILRPFLRSAFHRQRREYAKIVAGEGGDAQTDRNSGKYKRESLRRVYGTVGNFGFRGKGNFEIAQNRQTSDFSPIKEVLLENVAMIDRAIQTKGQVIGLSTGFKRLDELTSGLQKSIW